MASGFEHVSLLGSKPSRAPTSPSHYLLVQYLGDSEGGAGALYLGISHFALDNVEYFGARRVLPLSKVEFRFRFIWLEIGVKAIQLNGMGLAICCTATSSLCELARCRYQCLTVLPVASSPSTAMDA